VDQPRVRQSHGIRRTHRTDCWWLEPAATGLGLLLLFGYLTLRAFHPVYVWYEPYISPTVAPPVFTAEFGFPGSVPVEHAWLGAFPGWWPSFVPQSPAFVLPWLAIVFRLSCYYYRGAYYKAAFLTPPACAVRGVQRHYRGETMLLVIQNLHRYALYGGVFLLVTLWWEALHAFFRHGEFGIGFGTVMMTINAALLSSWTFGCHSWRHWLAAVTTASPARVPSRDGITPGTCRPGSMSATCCSRGAALAGLS
jgi:hypothetical protein